MGLAEIIAAGSSTHPFFLRVKVEFKKIMPKKKKKKKIMPKALGKTGILKPENYQPIHQRARWGSGSNISDQTHGYICAVLSHESLEE